MVYAKETTTAIRPFPVSTITADFREHDALSTRVLEPPIFGAERSMWGDRVEFELPDYYLRLSAHIRSKPERSNIGCGDHVAAFICNMPNCGLLVGLHGDDALGLGWKEGWQERVKKHIGQLEQIMPGMPWDHPDVVHANIIRGFTQSHQFKQFTANSRYRLSEAYAAELISAPVTGHSYPTLETVWPDIQWDFLKQKSQFLQSVLYDKLAFLTDYHPNFLKWYFNSVFGQVMFFIPEMHEVQRFRKDPAILASKLHSNADYYTDYTILPEDPSLNNGQVICPDPNRLVEELAKRLGLKGQEREALRLEKPDNVYSTYPLEELDIPEMRRGMATCTTFTSDVLPARFPVRGMLLSDGMGLPETSSQRYEEVGNTRRLQDAVKIVSQMRPGDADLHFTKNGYNGDDRSIIVVDLLPKSSLQSGI